MAKDAERYLSVNPRGQWRYERPIPVELRSAFDGRRLWRCSLKTDSRKQAITMKHQLDAETDALFERARQGMAADALVRDQAAIARKRLGEILPGMTFDDSQIGTIEGLRALRSDFEALERQVRLKTFTADGVIATELGQLPDEDPQIAALRRNALQIAREPLEYVDSLLTKAVGETAPKALQSGVMGLIDTWATESAPAAKTIGETRRYAQRMIDVCWAGVDRDPASVTKADAVKFRAELFKVPNTMTNAQRAQPVTQVIAAIERAGKPVPVIGPATVERHLGLMSAVFGHAVTAGLLESNPFEGVGVSKKSIARAKESYEPFTQGELTQIRAAILPLRNSTDLVDQWRYWLTWITMLIGNRGSEVGQLTAADVCQDEGVIYLNMRPDKDLGQRMKNEASKRRVPVPAKVLDEGFMAWVATRRASPGLFSDNPNKICGFDPVGKWFGRLKRSLGIVSNAKVFHSFRHGMKDELRRQGVNEELSDLITGHDNKSVGRSYGNGYSLSATRDVINKCWSWI